MWMFHLSIFGLFYMFLYIVFHILMLHFFIMDLSLTLLLVQYSTTQLSRNRPPFGTQVRLTLDITISIYFITPFFFSFVYFILQVIQGTGTSGRGRGRRPHRIATATTVHRGVPSLLHLTYRPKITHALVDSTGGSTTHFHGGLKVNRSQGVNVAIFFTRLIRNIGDCLHLAPPPFQCQPPCPMVINLGTYNIWGSRGFGLLQAVRAVKQGNYDLVILT